jgi:hypothetical protein
LSKWKFAIGKLKSYKSPGTDQSPAELIKAGGEKLCSEIYELICSICNKEELPQQWKESIIPVHKTVIILTVILIEDTPSYELQNFIQYSSVQVNPILLGFCRNRSITDQIFYIRQILEKKWEYNGTVHPLFIDCKKAYDSIKREVLYSILLELVCLRP